MDRIHILKLCCRPVEAESHAVHAKQDERTLVRYRTLEPASWYEFAQLIDLKVVVDEHECSGCGKACQF